MAANSKVKPPIQKATIIQRGFNEAEAARYIGMSKSYLQKDRTEGALAGRTPGPRWLKAGKRVIYLKDELDRWLEALYAKNQEREGSDFDDC